MAKRSIVDSDPDDSGPQNISKYSKQPSCEYTTEELREMERKARKEGKRDILLSQLVDQQEVTTKALADITTRLATGAQDISNLRSDQERLEEESNARLVVINKIGAQAQEATTLIKTHIDQCNERKKDDDKRKEIEDARWEMVQKSLGESTGKFYKNKESLWDKVTVNVVSSFLIAAIMGGLVAYFLFFKGLNDGTQNNARDDNKSQSSSGKK